MPAEPRSFSAGRKVGVSVEAGSPHDRATASRAETRARALETDGVYQRDLYTWASTQASLIRERRLDEIDWDNVAEEIESLGRSERNALVSFLALVIQHMLKWDYQPERRDRSWVVSIQAHRAHFAGQLDESPGLKSQLDDVLASAYRRAASQAAAETGLPRSHLPRECPYGLEEVLERLFEWPPGSERTGLD